MSPEFLILLQPFYILEKQNGSTDISDIGRKYIQYWNKNFKIVF